MHLSSVTGALQLFDAVPGSSQVLGALLQLLGPSLERSLQGLELTLQLRRMLRVLCAVALLLLQLCPVSTQLRKSLNSSAEQ